MTVNGWLQIALFCVLLLLITRPIGGYMARVFSGESTLLSPGAAPAGARHLPPVRRR